MSLVQQLAWLARCTCPQLAYDVNDSQQKTQESKVKDLVHLNHIVQRGYDLADQGHKLVYRQFKGEPLRVAVFDASWGRQTKINKESKSIGIWNRCWPQEHENISCHCASTRMEQHAHSSQNEEHASRRRCSRFDWI